ncbi:hypothetical protein UFOVP228_57 [uncultured Caudovirales phage]|uniref:Uncharacterized protein n=1 Tax=uncultured Caudovirales phage TaxID=2100421 RepID=A0A6J7WMM9_9CAUD|nr:hypothetical protein UFOVP47_45 [uncultured Caudovirales phage]CAB5219341.1 hypothetical protein UFOVP228_57 [uncultured Caudovirales phage]
MTPHIFEHINTLNPADFIDLDDASAFDTMGAQANTANDFLTRMGSPEHLIRENEAQHVREVFGNVTTLDLSDKEKKASVLTLKVPHAVKHLAGMLTQYDWDYVEQAKELRGYVVAKTMEETTHPDARIRLAALKMLGSLTEVGSFTERIEITKKEVSSSELQDRIRSKLESLLPKVVEVETVIPKPN